MDAAEFRQTRKRLGLYVRELGVILNTNDSTIRRWEMDGDHASTARAPNPVACQVLRWMLGGYRPPEWPERLRGR